MGINKDRARSKAREWWQNSRRSVSECDECNGSIKRPGGFLCLPRLVVPADLLCEACFDASTTAEAFEGPVPPDRFDPAESRTGPWRFILFLVAFVLTFSAWTGAIYQTAFHWRGIISVIQLILGLTLLGEAILLAFDLWRENPRALAMGFLYALTLLIYLIFLLFVSGAAVGIWIGTLAFWGVMILIILNYVASVADD